MTARLAIVIAALAMAVAVACGAFGAHALARRLAPDQLSLWHTAFEYHALHALGLLATGILMREARDIPALRVAAWLFVAGIVLFSGSLYALALGAASRLAFATPLGGIAFIAGWIVLAIGVARRAR